MMCTKCLPLDQIILIPEQGNNLMTLNKFLYRRESMCHWAGHYFHLLTKSPLDLKRDAT